MCLTVCCALYVTPAVGQGKLVAKKAGSTPAPWGYYEYLPQNYTQKSKHPVIVYLSGIGEQGNGTSELDKVLRHGPPSLIKNGKWPSSRPFLIFAPQSFGDFYNQDKLHSFIKHIIKNYRVDITRIYLTGLSAGGISVWNYLAAYPNVIAAAVPISGKGAQAVNKAGCSFKHVPIWAFHGNKDTKLNVNGSILPVETINACSPKPSPLAKVTVYLGVEHNAWTRTYDLSGMSSNTDKNYASYNKSIYDWMLTYTTEGAVAPTTPNQPPVADAGEDVSVLQSIGKVILKGTGSHDNDGNIVSYIWKKTSGPSANLSGANSSQLTVSNLSIGTYKFQLTVKDNDGDSNSDVVLVTVNANDVPTGNNGLTYEYYEGGWKKLPNYSSLKAVKSGNVSNFDLSPRKRNDNFGFLFEGYIEIVKAGQYTFYTSSDDGSRLYINKQEVVNNDGWHANRERSGKITLPVGYHYIKVKFFEKRGEQILVVKYAGPGISKQKIPNGKLFPQKPSGNPAPVASPPPPSNEEDEVVKFNVINPDNNRRVGELKPGSEVVLGSGINIEAVTNPSEVGSVKFVLNDEPIRVEGVAPYALGGDKNGNFGALKLSPGNYTLKAIPYTEAKAKGSSGQALVRKFKIIKGSKIGVNARTSNAAAVDPFFEHDKERKSEIVSVYPNPVEDKIHIQFNHSDAAGEISYRLLNYLGTGYEGSSANEQFSEGKLVIDVSQWNLSAGIYLLQVTYNQGEQKVYRIIKK